MGVVLESDHERRGWRITDGRSGLPGSWCALPRAASLERLGPGDALAAPDQPGRRPERLHRPCRAGQVRDVGAAGGVPPHPRGTDRTRTPACDAAAPVGSTAGHPRRTRRGDRLAQACRGARTPVDAGHRQRRAPAPRRRGSDQPSITAAGRPAGADRELPRRRSRHPRHGIRCAGSPPRDGRTDRLPDRAGGPDQRRAPRTVRRTSSPSAPTATRSSTRSLGPDRTWS